MGWVALIKLGTSPRAIVITMPRHIPLATVLLALCGAACGPPVHRTPSSPDTTHRTASAQPDTNVKSAEPLLRIDTMPSIDSLQALATRYPLSATAPSAILNVTPGSSLLDLSQLHPYHRTYVVFSYTCEPTTDEPPTRSGDYIEDLTFLGDSAILLVETWHRGSQPEVRDSIFVDRRTLAFRSAVGHGQGWSDLWIVRDGKASFWSSDMNVPSSQSVDTIIGEPTLVGSLELLLAITPRVYPGDATVSYRVLGLATHPGDTPEITVNNLAVRAVDTATAQPFRRLDPPGVGGRRGQRGDLLDRPRDSCPDRLGCSAIRVHLRAEVRPSVWQVAPLSVVAAISDSPQLKVQRFTWRTRAGTAIPL